MPEAIFAAHYFIIFVSSSYAFSHYFHSRRRRFIFFADAFHFAIFDIFIFAIADLFSLPLPPQRQRRRYFSARRRAAIAWLISPDS
jgi:hypothetical protein